MTSRASPATSVARPPRRARLRRRLRRGAVTLGVLVALVVLVQPLRVRVVAAATVADALDLPVPRPFAATVERERTEAGGVPGDLYDAGASRPAIVLLPGAAPDGIEDPRIVRLAEAVASSGRTVFVPELEVYEQRLVVDDVDRIVRATVDLSGDERGPAVVLGTSFGGSLGLIAAADGRLADRVATVATFGAYADLLGVLQAATTGVSLVDGRSIPWDADPRADDVVRRQVARLLPPDQRAQLAAALDGRRERADLDDGARAAFDLLKNDDPSRTHALARRLPTDARERIAEVSPVSVARDVAAPVVAMHSTTDRAIPYGELVRLGDALPHARLVTLDRFEHVGLPLDSPRAWIEAAGDLRAAWRFATVVLGAQEPWWPG